MLEAPAKSELALANSLEPCTTGLTWSGNELSSTELSNCFADSCTWVEPAEIWFADDEICEDSALTWEELAEGSLAPFFKSFAPDLTWEAPDCTFEAPALNWPAPDDIWLAPAERADCKSPNFWYAATLMNWTIFALTLL